MTAAAAVALALQAFATVRSVWGGDALPRSPSQVQLPSDRAPEGLPQGVGELFGVRDAAPGHTALEGGASADTVTLFGTLALRPGGQGLAILRSGDDHQRLHATGSVTPAGVLAEVHTDRIVLVDGGRRLEIRMPKQYAAVLALGMLPDAEEPAPEHEDPAIARAIRDARFTSSIAVSEPVVTEGGLRAVVLQPAAGDALLGMFGLAPGDWITHVDGAPIDAPGVAARLRGAFVNGGRVKLQLARQGYGLREVVVEIPATGASAGRTP